MKTSTSFKPGQSGNPKGAPKKEHSITQTIRDMMDEKPEVKKALGGKILQMALNGDIVAMKTIWNYLDGMPKQSLGLSGDEENPLVIKIVEDLQEKREE